MFKNTCTQKTIENEINKDLQVLTSWTNKWRLTLAAHKCAFIQFKKYNQKTNETNINSTPTKKRKRTVKKTNINTPVQLNLMLDNQPLKQEKVYKFLGIRFDECCKFDQQINHIKGVVSDRLNVLKILSHRSWKLSLANRKQLYCSLVRSVIEYSSFLLPILTQKLLNLVNTIQNNALRIILNKKRTDKISIVELHKLADIESIESRLQRLRVDFLYKALSSNNPLISEIVVDYMNYSGGRLLKFRSLLDKANLRLMMGNARVVGS